MKREIGYFRNGDRISVVPEDGLRINVHSPGIVTTQMDGQLYKEHNADTPNGFNSMSHTETGSPFGFLGVTL